VPEHPATEHLLCFRDPLEMTARDLASWLDRLTRGLRLDAVDAGILQHIKDRLARDEKPVGDVLPELRATVERLKGTW
jgi:hypothetical protein